MRYPVFLTQFPFFLGRRNPTLPTSSDFSSLASLRVWGRALICSGNGVPSNKSQGPYKWRQCGKPLGYRKVISISQKCTNLLLSYWFGLSLSGRLEQVFFYAFRRTPTKNTTKTPLKPSKTPLKPSKTPLKHH